MMSADAAALRARQRARFFRCGIAFAVASGMCYGLYTAFLTLAETMGPWGLWMTGGAALSTFTVTYALAALAAGLNDLWSGVWSLLVCVRNGQIGDLVKTVRTKPGRMMMLCAVVGGPFATVCYVVALNSATAAGAPGVIVPIAALNCAIGAVLGHVLFRQKIAAHTLAGIVVCLAAAALIGGASLTDMGPGVLVGCLSAFLAAFGWGFEGCVAGFGTTLVDYRIGIAIRQCTAGVLELAVVFPVLAAIGDGWGAVPELLGAAVSDPSIIVFAISGLLAMPAYSFWYKGNSMCGTALGMACNGMYAFWGPFFIWVLLGLLNVGGLSSSYPPLGAAQWAGAVVMVCGIFLIAVSPSGALRGRVGAEVRGTDFHPETGVAAPAVGSDALPLFFAVIDHFSGGATDDAEGVVASLRPAYAHDRQLSAGSVSEALATAKENGLLDEVGSALDERGVLRVYYAMNDFGRQMADRYIPSNLRG